LFLKLHKKDFFLTYFEKWQVTSTLDRSGCFNQKRLLYVLKNHLFEHSKNLHGDDFCWFQQNSAPFHKATHPEVVKNKVLN
jgi:hypothetical protein